VLAIFAIVVLVPKKTNVAAPAHAPILSEPQSRTA
jgi:hypothetical protein